MMWPFNRKRAAAAHRETPLYLHNTLGGEKQRFTMPAIAKTVRMYNCGPTVYGRQHIGNLSMFVFADTLRRTLESNDLTVKQVINITDVGHLTSDADEGEDKMSKGLKREGMELSLENMRSLAEKYTALFQEDIRALNIDTARIEFPRASDFIPAQIAMTETLVQKGYAYETEDGVYFDTTRFPDYGALGGIDLEGLKAGARVATVAGKRHPTDFALWKKNAKLGWESPWGKGFPGWHIECSAMIRRTLGEQIDIHTGGIEHIPVHHNNEIAQSEAVTGKKPLSRFWLHRAHVQIESQKIAKSEGNVVYLSDITDKGFAPLALRYLFLGAHYRTSSNFSWEALEASQNALFKLYDAYENLEDSDAAMNADAYVTRFRERVNDDLDTPGALAVLWEMTRDAGVSVSAKRAAAKEFDAVLGLNLNFYMDAISDIPASVDKLLREREAARNAKDWKRSDELRDQIAELGYRVRDTGKGPKITKKERA